MCFLRFLVHVDVPMRFRSAASARVCGILLIHPNPDGLVGTGAAGALRAVLSLRKMAKSVLSKASRKSWSSKKYIRADVRVSVPFKMTSGGTQSFAGTVKYQTKSNYWRVVFDDGDEGDIPRRLITVVEAQNAESTAAAAACAVSPEKPRSGKQCSGKQPLRRALQTISRLERVAPQMRKIVLPKQYCNVLVPMQDGSLEPFVLQDAVLLNEPGCWQVTLLEPHVQLAQRDSQ